MEEENDSNKRKRPRLSLKLEKEKKVQKVELTKSAEIRNNCTDPLPPNFYRLPPSAWTDFIEYHKSQNPIIPKPFPTKIIEEKMEEDLEKQEKHIVVKPFPHAPVGSFLDIGPFWIRRNFLRVVQFAEDLFLWTNLMIT